MQNDNPSFEKVNYLLRPRKQIERKILIDLFRRISDIHSYQYIGMGSISYYDFILFHKFLNIKQMISLDDKITKRRFIFNRPYDFIRFIGKKTTDFLDTHNFKQKAIFWLDYDLKLYDYERDIVRQTIIDDIDLISSNAKCKTFFIITIDINYPRDKKEQDAFREHFAAYIPATYKSDTFLINVKRFYSQYRLMIQGIVLNYIEDRMKLRDIKFHKLFSFYYKDGHAPMFTLGGIFDTNDGYAELWNMLSGNQFINVDNNHITNIDVPILTYKEKTYLDAMINELQDKILSVSGKKARKDILSDIEFELRDIKGLEEYIKYYRYYPQYYEGII